MTSSPAGPPRLGLRANAGQFALLVGGNALVGGMIGQERTVLPLVAQDIFGLTGAAAILTVVFAVGVTKAGANLAAGALGDRVWPQARPGGLGMPAAIMAVAALADSAGLVVFVRMRETRSSRARLADASA